MDMRALIDRLRGIEDVGGVDLMPMPEVEIVAFEGELGIRLPEEYRRFLAAYGGRHQGVVRKDVQRGEGAA